MDYRADGEIAHQESVSKMPRLRHSSCKALVVIAISTFFYICIFNWLMSPTCITIKIDRDLSPLEWKSLTWTENLFGEASRDQKLSGSSPVAKKFLTIGIATVYREQEYLRTTLESFVNQSWPEERQLATIVIFLADTDEQRRYRQFKLVQNHFPDYVESGFIQMIVATPSIYPPFDFALRLRTYNHTIERVIWRTKQVIDFSFLFIYVRHHVPCEYYLVAEDDLVASNQYLTAIKDFVILKRNDGSTWTALQFARFIGIGLLFDSSLLEKLTDFLLLFHKEHPVDILLKMFTRRQNPKIRAHGVVYRDPSTFQHIGKMSTRFLTLQPQLDRRFLVDHTFGHARREFEHKNPQALRFRTTLNVERSFVPENAYSPAPGWFCGTSSRNFSGVHFFDIVYAEPILVRRIVVISRIPMKKKCLLKQGYLSVGGSVEGSPASEFCKHLDFIKAFNPKGIVDVGINVTLQCIRLGMRVAMGQSICIKEIQVFQL